MTLDDVVVMLIIAGLVLSFGLGFVAGQQR